MASLENAMEWSTAATEEEARSRIPVGVDFIEVNYASKSLAIPNYYKIMGVAGDQESRRLWFKIKNITDEMVMKDSALEVRYWNTAKEEGRYAVTDMFEEEGNVYFSFLPPYSLTSRPGNVSIAVVALQQGKEWRIGQSTFTIANFPTGDPIEPIDPKYDIVNQVILQVVGMTNQINDNSDRLDAIEPILSTFYNGTEVIDGTDLYFLNNGNIIDGPIRVAGTGGGTGGGGGGGGSTSDNNAIFTVRNLTGISLKVSEGQQAVYSIECSSTEDGELTGTMNIKVTVNNVQVLDLDVNQGVNDIDIAQFCKVGSNSVRFVVRDCYNNIKTLMSTCRVYGANLTSYVDDGVPISGDFYYTFVATGNTDKTMHYVLDGVERETEVITTSGRQSTYYIPEQTHGVHTFEVYFTADIEGNSIESNHLTYNFLWVAPDSRDTLVSVSMSKLDWQQFDTVVIPHTVYDPSSITSSVNYYVDGILINTTVVGRERQYWSYRANETGQHVLKIEAGNAYQEVTITVTQRQIKAQETREDQILHLTAYGRHKGEEHPDVWVSDTTNPVPVTFTGMDWNIGGWQLDDEGNSVFRLMEGMRAEIGLQPMSFDWRSSGFTMSFEFTTHSVRKYDAAIVSCMDNMNRGFIITANELIQRSEQSELSTTYKDDTHIRIDFVTEKSSANRLINCYINGKWCRCAQYPVRDDFEQLNPVNITLGNEFCGIDIYTIRMYKNDLTRHQVLENVIVDRPDGGEIVAMDTRNDVYNEFGQIDIAKLWDNHAVLILEGDLPQYKGDKKTIAGQFIDPVNPDLSFTFVGAEIDVQGTSSQYYERKNYKIKFKNGFILEVDA